MDNNIYISRGGWFSFTLIDGWQEYDDGDDSTHAFWHETETSWTGNFRITTFQWPDTTAIHEDKACEYITTEIAENADAQRIILGKNDCAYYKKESQLDGLANVVYYWITGKQNHIFICTFAFDKIQEAMLIHERELTSIQNMIASIKII